MSETLHTDSARGQPQDQSDAIASPFVDLSRPELEKLLGEASARAAEVLATQGRLRDLLHAHAVVASELDVQAVLQHVVVAARELVQARYAALGVIGEGGLLDEFVHVGMDEAAVERIGELPHGRGILGLLTSHPSPVRLDDLTAHPAAAGFPPNHPAMESFLGVPIRIGDRVFGNLYFTGSENGRFSAEDEQLAVALAATAGVAIENARLFHESEQRHRWLVASTNVTRQLFAGQDPHPLDLVLRAAQQTASADFATLALINESGHLRVRAVSGVLTDHVFGLLLDMDTSLSGQVVQSGTPVLTNSAQNTGGVELPVRIGSVIVVPLVSGDEVIGAVSVGRVEGRQQFTDADMGHVAGFASHAGVAMELDRVRVHRQDRRLSDEHDRIGTDLNDHVIKKLFAVSIGLNSLLSTTQPHLHKRITSYTGVLDDTINRIRTTIYDIDDTPDTEPKQHKLNDLQQRILTAADDHALILGFPVLTSFSGKFGRAIPLTLADDIITVIRAGLNAIAGHVRATHAELRVSADGDLITAEVIDNGTSNGTSLAIDGLGSFVNRTANGGSAPLSRGTHLTWTTHIPADQ
ncbi:GAF domain-containing protein [Umezawaea sp. Da 62-37]|uniref:GAF domain-containing protein n=1 Tax=Umezawaea sp. Da 62-37 TaxID=3075927 RepID=UPI0028F6CEFB|nr:GAF domain-containing protein [Umezawaea sp. Da 62-37]WNV84776.1 GAF domain-containing protein [Umezawaea sp. Da 62-37]